MNSTQTDLRALRRGPRTNEQPVSPSPAALGTSEVVPRPKARWATRLLVPAIVLVATGGLLAYAARDALQPRLEVYVAAAIPKGSAVATAPAASDAVSESVEVNPADAPLGPVAVQAPGWIEPAPYAVSVPALTEGGLPKAVDRHIGSRYTPPEYASPQCPVPEFHRHPLGGGNSVLLLQLPLAARREHGVPSGSFLPEKWALKRLPALGK